MAGEWSSVATSTLPFFLQGGHQFDYGYVAKGHKAEV